MAAIGRGGRDLAIALERRYPREDWVAELARRAHKSRDYVEWHLQEDMQPPEDVLAAAVEMLRERDADSSEDDSSEDDGADVERHGLKSADDLPFAGLPGNLGKLRKT